jgi:hypothetical protein
MSQFRASWIGLIFRLLRSSPAADLWLKPKHKKEKRTARAACMLGRSTPLLPGPGAASGRPRAAPNSNRRSQPGITPCTTSHPPQRHAAPRELRSNGQLAIKRDSGVPRAEQARPARQQTDSGSSNTGSARRAAPRQPRSNKQVLARARPN